MNEHVVLDARAARSWCWPACTDYSAHHFDADARSDPRAALAGAPRGRGARRSCSRTSRAAPPAADAAGFDLQLSGHTHGGQFWPWNSLRAPAAAVHGRAASAGRLWVYISRGTGYWGPPKRFGAPSEITRRCA